MPKFSKPRSQRQLQMGEELRHRLSSVFLRGEFHAPELHGTSITVSEVAVSPDLKNATVYVMPLGGKDRDLVIRTLKEEAAQFRYAIGKGLHTRHVPQLTFRLDETFDNAGKIHELLRDPQVMRDLDEFGKKKPRRKKKD